MNNLTRRQWGRRSELKADVKTAIKKKFTKTASVTKEDHRGEVKTAKAVKNCQAGVSVQQSEFVTVRYGEADETEVSGLKRRET